MEEYKIFQELRKKKNRTREEELLLKYRRILGEISNIVVSKNKQHICADTALEDIRDCLRDSAW